MTNESRRAFDAEWLKYTPEDDKPMTKIIAEHFWQASEAHILALLGSEEMVVGVAKSFNNAWEYLTKAEKNRCTNHAKSAIEAIKQRINKGE